MQWLIDIIKRWVLDQAYLTTGFVDRGDPAAWDYTLEDFTTDGTWREWDLSAIVPPGAKAVYLRFYYRDNAVNSYLILRRHGNAHNIACVLSRTQVANVPQDALLPLALDADRKADYNFKSVVFDFIYVAVLGWWL